MARRTRSTRRLDVASVAVDANLAVLQLADSALPVGTFAHSFGLESALADGSVRDEVDVADWLQEFVRGQLVTTDLLAVREVYAAVDGGAGAFADIAGIDEVLTASTLAVEAREASRTMGARLLEVALDCFPSPLVRAYSGAVRAGECTGHYAVAMALTLAGLGIAREEAMRAYATSVLVGLTQNAVRAVPLGQAAGQRVITSLHPAITRAVATAQTLPSDLLGACSPQLEIAQMRHEHLHARMFSS